MGMTFTTLHLWGIERGALVPRLAPGDLLREQNAPWLSVTPDYEEAREDPGRLEKLAKRLTKENESAAALLFYYYDDDWFLVRFFQGGKKTVDSGSAGAWAKLGKKLDELFGDEAPGKALRYLSRCSGLQEQIALVEETVGAALFDVSEEEQPRRMPRGDQTLRAIKARESALRKRPNQFVLTELPREDWPEAVRYWRDLYERLRPEWRKYELSRLPGPDRILVPTSTNWLAHSYMDGREHRDRLLLFEGSSGQLTDRELPRGTYRQTVWMTPEGEPVVLLLHILQERFGPSVNSWGRTSGKGFAVCLGKDGGERWRFEPELEKYQQCLNYAHTSPEGILMLYSGWGTYYDEQYGAQIWRIDGNTGEILYHRELPEKERLHHLLYVEALDAFAYGESEKKQLVLLDSSLREIARWDGYTGNGYDSPENLWGSVLWVSGFTGSREVRFLDLRDGRAWKTPLEMPVWVRAVLPDGRILGMNEKCSALTIFDREGKVVSRCSVPGSMSLIRTEKNRVCFDEWRGPDTHGFIYDELFDETTFHVWRLDPAPEKKKEAKGSRK
ncbi:MAG: hypothetical protein IJK63_07790 [Oscillospiraceae bacterium]|nr:hypothetical protein [Oscillospiraceae bacterium]